MTMPAIFHAATGHRPEKLGGHGLDVQQRLVALAMCQLERDRPDVAISGMALGWDLAWAVAAIKLGIPVSAYVPFDGYHAVWPEASQKKYKLILAKCFEVRYVCTPGYSARKLQRRNEWMVDRARLMVALWDGSEGGTANCVRYAWQVQKPVTNLWPEWLQRAE